MHPKVLCSPVYNRQDMETTCMSIYWIHKDVVHTNNGILLTPPKEWNVAIKKNEILPFAETWKTVNPEWSYMKWVKVAQSCPTPCDPMDYIVHGILQIRILEWEAFPFSMGSSQSRDRTQVSCIAGGFFTRWATRERQILYGITYMWNLKNNIQYKWFIYKTEIDSQT